MQTQTTSTGEPNRSSAGTSRASQDEERTGEDAVRRAADVVINRSSDGSGKRVRRRSRKPRNAALLDGGGLKFHYLVGILLGLSLLVLMFQKTVSTNFWKLLHPPAPAPVAGAASVPAGPPAPPPWWFHPEVLALLLGLAVWLYLTPGVWDSIKTSIGLKKDKEKRSRRRHS